MHGPGMGMSNHVPWPCLVPSVVALLAGETGHCRQDGSPSGTQEQLQAIPKFAKRFFQVLKPVGSPDLGGVALKPIRHISTFSAAALKSCQLALKQCVNPLEGFLGTVKPGHQRCRHAHTRYE